MKVTDKILETLLNGEDSVELITKDGCIIWTAEALGRDNETAKYWVTDDIRKNNPKPIDSLQQLSVFFSEILNRIFDTGGEFELADGVKLWTRELIADAAGEAPGYYFKADYWLTTNNGTTDIPVRKWSDIADAVTG